VSYGRRSASTLAATGAVLMATTSGDVIWRVTKA